MTSIGETLHRERLRAGLDLEKVSQETKISVRMLELIEADQFDKLPGGVFARSFVRQYARLLGLDEEEMAGELRRMTQTQPEPEAESAAPRVAAPDVRVPPVPQWQGFSRRSLGPNSSLPALAWVVVVVLACSLAYTWWQKSRHSAPSTPEEAVAAAPAVRPPEPSPAASAPPANPSAAAPVTPAVDSPAGASPAAEPIPPAAGTTLRIALTAEEATWVSASLNGKTLYAGTLQPKETKSLEAGATIKLVIGNAGGLEISLNGKPIPPVGPRGQVRVVQFAPDGAVQVIPKKPPVPEPL